MKNKMKNEELAQVLRDQTNNLDWFLPFFHNQSSWAV